ncbi:MAG: hypothetical protein OEY01_01510 [Desulfobulbaceae bacterium]|nr:hypothetical protein [Desulfobulbaceae bacterium]HIJ77968.1 hypothetical protein [Deltaproteobacteria bacterium]
MDKIEGQKDQSKDAGLAIVLILLLCVFWGGYQFLLLPSIICLVITMACPSFFKVWANIWFRFSHLLGGIVSKILLSLVFWFVVLPIGFLRKMSGADSMNINSWKKSNDSVFVERNHLVVKHDLEKPY